MADIKAEEAVLQMTIQVTRKETGKVEEYTLTAKPEDLEITDIPKLKED